MKYSDKALGDNFPVAEGLNWNPRIPWRHGKVVTPANTLLKGFAWLAVAVALIVLLIKAL